MIKTKDEMEKTMLSAEEEEKEEVKDSEDENDEEDTEEGGGDDEEKKAEVEAGATGGKIQPAGKKKNKAQSDVLNLNNEVVKMRKEVKRVRALIIRKLTRQIAALKKKKGKEMDLERNQRRAARLLEEVHSMKDLSPDLVTKTALQKSLNFEKVCKNPKSTISDRATARIATHPQFSKKIEDIKAAIKAFKDERMKGGKLVEKEKDQQQAEKTNQRSPNKQVEQKNERKEEQSAVKLQKVEQKSKRNEEQSAVKLQKLEQKSERKEEQSAVKPQKATDDDDVGGGKDTDEAAVAEAEEETCSEAPASVQLHKIQASKSVKAAVVKTCDSVDTEGDEHQSEAPEKQAGHEAAPSVTPESSDDQESELESSDDEEKEYFDDSTEERFHKQSSQSEESDDDDFFLGKVSKFKKKKKKEEEEEGKKDSTDSRKPADKLQKELDELDSRLKSKGSPFQSVFCSSLTGAKAGRGGATGRGRGDRGRGDRFRGQGRPQGGSGPSRAFSQQGKFEKQEKGPEGHSASRYSKPCPDSSAAASGFAGRGRGRGRGRGDAFRQGGRGRGGFSHQAPQEALHPSWEASKKRKEQQGQILAFQGKKIKFDDDD